MDNSLFSSLFDRAREQYERSTRWTTVVILLLLGFHVLFYSHYIELDAKLALAEGRLAEHLRAHEATKNVANQLNELSEEADAQMVHRLDQTLEELRSDLAKLSSMADGIRAEEIEPPAPGVPAEPNAGISPDDTRSSFSPDYPGPAPSITPYSLQHQPAGPQSAHMALQAPLYPEEELPFRYIPLPIDIDDVLAEHIKATRDINALRELLRPTVETQIIKPRFDQLNKYWEDEILPLVKKRAKGLNSVIEDAKKDVPEETARWDELARQVDIAMEGAQQLRFRPPDTPFWVSVAGKGAMILQVHLSARAALREFSSTDTFLETMEAAVDRQKALERRLEKKLGALEDAFKQKKRKLSAFGASLENLPIDLATTVSWFPAFIGFAVAGLWIWQAHRLQELGWVVREMTSEDPGSPLRAWLMARLSSPWAERNSLVPVLSAVGLGGAALVWVCLATLELAEWPPAGPGRVLTQGALAAAALTAAVFYRSRVVIHVHKALGLPDKTPAAG